MSTIARHAPWWKTAPNPECTPFCTEEHAPDEFTQGGALMCSILVVATTHFTVKIQQWVGATSNDAPRVIHRDPVLVYLDMASDNQDDLLDLTPDAARQLGADLHMALARAAHMADEANR